MNEKINWMYDIHDTIDTKNGMLTITGREIRRETFKDSTCVTGYSTKNTRYYKCTCGVCGWNECYMNEYELKRGRGCSCCHSKTVVKGINDIPTTAPWMIKFFQGKYDEASQYTKSSGQKIYPICPDCGTIKDRAVSIHQINTNRSIGCLCGDGISYPNKFSYCFLDQLSDQICDYEREFRPEWCKYELDNKVKQGVYDNKFVLKSNNRKYILEMDGEFHNSNRFDKSFPACRADKEKDLLAKLQGYKVIRIDCRKSDADYIKNNILNSELNAIFDLSYVDWNACDDFAMSNLSKEIINYYNKGKNTLAEIGNVFNLHESTVRNYLKHGTKLGLCDYDPKVSKSNASRKNCHNTGKANGIKVEVLKDGISYGVFESAAQIQRLSLEKFGTKLHDTAIGLCCRNKYGVNNIYKGFNFNRVII